jgi:NAD(P)-dependent dehydrogenase (short-subunit alcohol dehydrogenase family)
LHGPLLFSQPAPPLGKRLSSQVQAQRLLGRVAIVTGAASGIGAASSSLFAAHGAHVLAVDRDPDPLMALADSHPRISPLTVDLSDGDAPALCVEAARRLAGGRLDIVFANAGIAVSAPVAGHGDADWQRVLDVNLSASFRLARAAIEALCAAPAGRFIATASLMADHTDHGLAAYCASKAGLTGLVRALALEMGRHGATANWIEPGAIRTGMTAALWDARPDIAEIWARKAVLRRLGNPDDVARVALFLASDDSAFVTGQGIAVDGGMTLRA